MWLLTKRLAYYQALFVLDGEFASFRSDLFDFR